MKAAKSLHASLLQTFCSHSASFWAFHCSTRITPHPQIFAQRLVWLASVHGRLCSQPGKADARTCRFPYYSAVMDVRDVFARSYSSRARSLQTMVNACGVSTVGCRKHCGLDDARAVTEIVKVLLLQGARFSPSSQHYAPIAAQQFGVCSQQTRTPRPSLRQPICGVRPP